MTDNAGPAALIDPRYRVGGSFGVLRAITVKKLWGLWATNSPLQLPAIPADALLAESWVSYDGVTVDMARVSLDFLADSSGKAFFGAYVEALRAFVAQHKEAVDERLLSDCLSWSVEVEIFDSAAPTGSRTFSGSEPVGMQMLENTVDALRRYRASPGSLTILNDDAAEHSEQHYKYLSMAHYMAFDDRRVLIHFHDFNDDSEDADEVLHRVSLEREGFADAMSAVHARLKALTGSVCAALGVRPGQLGRARRRP